MRNLEWPKLAQQSCAEFCRGILRFEACFLGVVFSAVGIDISIVPVHFALQGPFGLLVEASIQCAPKK